VSFSSSSLPIGEDSPIVPFHHILNDRISALSKDSFLFCIPVVDAVKGKDLGHIFLGFLD